MCAQPQVLLRLLVTAVAQQVDGLEVTAGGCTKELPSWRRRDIACNPGALWQRGRDLAAFYKSAIAARCDSTFLFTMALLATF